MNKRLCAIYRCSKKEGMYVYVDNEQGFEGAPEGLLKQIGKTELAMTLLLTADKKLARANAQEVLNAIHEQGFYLQLPPSTHSVSQNGKSATTSHGVDTEMAQLYENNHLLNRE